VFAAAVAVVVARVVMGVATAAVVDIYVGNIDDRLIGIVELLSNA